MIPEIGSEGWVRERIALGLPLEEIDRGALRYDRSMAFPRDPVPVRKDPTFTTEDLAVTTVDQSGRFREILTPLRLKRRGKQLRRKR